MAVRSPAKEKLSFTMASWSLRAREMSRAVMFER